MFKELSPYLSKRNVVLTLVKNQDDLIRVTVTPTLKDKDDSNQLAQPFVVEGTAEELDAGLDKTLVGYTSEMLTLERSLAQLKSSTEAAVKEAKAESDKKIAEARGKNKSAADTRTPAVTKTEEKKPEPPKAPEPLSLFASVEAAPATPAPAKEASAPAITTAKDSKTQSVIDEENEIIEEVNNNGSEDMPIAA